MHHIYHTSAIVLGSRNYGEADKYYYLFTRELGLVYASATGVRKVESKLRYVLQDFAYLKIDLVQGRDFWRVTNASKTNKLESITQQPANLKVFVNIARLLKRLLAGVEANETLFDDVLNGLLMLEQTKEKADLRNIEAILVLRILNNLGYIGGDEVSQDLAKSPFEQDLIFEFSKSRSQVLRTINKALKETHL